jgi:hypothetical protein
MNLTSKREFTQDWEIQITEEGTFIPKSTCFCFLACDFANKNKLHNDSKERKLLDDFSYWLEGLLEVCDGQEGKSNYNCQDTNNKKE